MTCEEFSALIDAIYSAAIDPRNWETVFRLLTERLHAIAAADRQLEPEAVSLMRRLAPHLQRAVAANQRIGSACGLQFTAFAALDRLSTAAIFLTEDNVSFHANLTGERLLQAGDGLAIRRGRVRATHPDASRALDHLIHKAATGTAQQGETIALPRPRPELPPLLTRVLPVAVEHPLLSGPQTRAILLVTRPEDKAAPEIEPLARLHGLTPAETRLVAALVQRKNLTDAAKMLGVRKDTARKHLAHIMAKTQIHRQAELISLFLSVRLPTPGV
jgi:DNA-binding CsgD family transcriptional regulator